MEFVLYHVKEGDKLILNGLAYHVTRVEPDVDMSSGIESKIIFLTDGKADYRIFVQEKDIKSLLLEKIKVKSVSHPWDYTIIASQTIKTVKLDKDQK